MEELPITRLARNAADTPRRARRVWSWLNDDAKTRQHGIGEAVVMPAFALTVGIIALLIIFVHP